MNTNRIASAIFACLLVTAGVAGPMAQPAVAAEAGECTALDDFVMFATLGAVNVEDCSREAYVQDAIADYEQTDAEQTKVDIYSEAQQTKQGAENYMAPFNNYINDTESVAWSKMQVAVAEAYENGSTEAQARYEAEKAVEEYYAVKQRNLIAQHNTHLLTMDRLYNVADMETNVSADSFVDATSDSWGVGGSDRRYRGLSTFDATLANGTTVEVYRFHFDNGGGNYSAHKITNGVYGGPDPYMIGIGAPTESYDTLNPAYNVNTYAEPWSRIETKQSALVAEAKTFVNATYADFDSGEANASDVIDANTAMFEYGTRSGNESESLYNSVAALSLMGFDTPDLNSSGTMTVGYQNQQYTGMILARNAPNGSWQAGTTYNTSNIDGPVFLATTDGQKIDLSGEFRINELRAKDGSSIDSVNTTQYAYKTANASELMEMQSRLTALRQEIEHRQPSGGGGGSGGFGGNTMLFVLAALAAGAIALGSQNGGGGRNRGRR